MTCLDENTLVAFFESPRERALADRVHGHAAECAACRKLLAAYAALAPAQGSGRASGTDAASTAPLPGTDVAEGLLPSGSRLGRYVVLSLVGMGGLGVVYEAYDPELDRRIAVKLLRRVADEESAAVAGRELLQREARALARVSHRNVVAVHDVGVFEGRVFIAMEFVAGATLRAWLAAEPRGWRRVLEAFREAGQGLAAAHDAGLVHRDFKPDNVLVRTDGHVCVTDFGLARATRLGQVASTQDLVRTQTLTGGVTGTPGYMAPEVWAGGVADARSDQFAFAVSLFEGLCGARPHDGTTLPELREAILAGKTKDLPPPTGVPPWLARAVARGLSTDPSARFGSMRDMLAAIAEPRPARRGVLIAAVAATVAAVCATPVVLSARTPKTAPVPVCRAGEDKVRGLWDEPRRDAVRKAFEATGASYAGQAWAAVDAAIAGFSRDWVATYTDACEATRVRGEQSEALLDQRMVCLEQRRKEVAALADGYSHADGKAVDSAVEAAANIAEPLSSCSAEALRGAKPWPKDPAARAKLEDVQTRLALALSLRDRGRFMEAREVAAGALEPAKDAGYGPLQVQVGLDLARMEGNSGDPAARKHALDAALLAQSEGLDDLAAEAWTALVMVVGREGDFAPAHLYARLASADLDRLGGDEPMRRGRLLLYESFTHVAEMHFPEALDASTRAMDLIDRAAGERSIAYAHALVDRAMVFGGMGRYAEALADYEHFVSIATDLLGPDHPDTIEGFFGRAEALDALGRYQEALDDASVALRGMERSHGPDADVVAQVRGLIAHLTCRLGRCAEALPVIERALGSWSAAGDAAEKVDGSALYLDRAEIELALGDTRDADRDGRKALELAGADDDSVVALLELARIARARGSLAEALAHARHAVDILDKSSPDSANEAPALAVLGEILAARGDSAGARRAIERAIAVFDAHPGDPHVLEAARALLPKLP